MRAVRLSSPAAPTCFARLAPINGKYTSLIKRFRTNELNTFGWMVEADPYDGTQALRKRTALGRFAHESAAFGLRVPGRPLAVYMGDDSRGEYIYKFVSGANWDAADANPANRITTGDGNDIITGGLDHDRVTDSGGTNVIATGGGDDRVTTGGAGNGPRAPRVLRGWRPTESAGP